MEKRMSKVQKRSLREWRVGLVLILCLIWIFGSGSRLKYTEDRTPTVLNPIYADDMYSVRSTELVFEQLIGWDKEQRPSPMLATSWKMAKNKRSIVLNLRKNVYWHDGKQFTADDVIFTIKTMTSSRAQLTDRYLASILKAPKKNNKFQLTIYFKKPLNRPLKWLQFKIIPAHPFKKRRVSRRHIFNQRPVGTGPYKFKRWVGRKIQFVRYKKHWRGTSKIKIKKVSLQAIPDKNIQVAVLQYGGLDAIIRVRPKDIPTFEKNRNVQLYPYSTNDWWYIGLNHRRRSILKNQSVREALIYALDRENLQQAHLGDGQVISGPFSPNDPLYNFSVNPRTQNLSKAKALLKKAGWKAKSGKTYRYKGGKELSLRLLVPKSKSSYKALCQGIKGELAKVGVKVILVWLDDTAWSRSVMKSGKFDMALHIWNFDDLASIYPLFHSKGTRNYIGYKNKEVDRLLKQATRTTDPVIYKAIYGKIHKLLHKELPYLFLWSLTNYSAVSSKVRRVTIHPFNYFHYVHSWKRK